MKYIIIATITDLDINDISPWINSLNKIEYDDKRIMIVYNVSDEVIKFLLENDFEVFSGELDPRWRTENSVHLYNQRFRDAAMILSNTEGDRVIWTDVRDVIFQRDPREWIEKNKTNHILACSEGIRLGDDDWATTCAGTSFPMEWEWLQKEESFCAGCIVGDKDYIIDLFYNIHRWGITGANSAQAADQPAYNILIKQKQFQKVVQYVKQEEGLAIQMGTTYIKKDWFGDKLLEPTPLITEDGMVTNQIGEPFCIVHQYDRDPNLKQIIYERYNDK